MCVPFQAILSRSVSPSQSLTSVSSVFFQGGVVSTVEVRVDFASFSYLKANIVYILHIAFVTSQ